MSDYANKVLYSINDVFSIVVYNLFPTFWQHTDTLIIKTARFRFEEQRHDVFKAIEKVKFFFHLNDFEKTKTSDNHMVRYQESKVYELGHPISRCSVYAASVSKRVVWRCNDKGLSHWDLAKSDVSF